MAQFDDAKVGDRVWGIDCGLGTIDQIFPSGEYPVVVDFDLPMRCASYTFDGLRRGNDINPTLFWDEVKIVPPERPKEHRHNFHTPILNGRAEIFAYQCRCGDRVIEKGKIVKKEKCEACEFIERLNKSTCYPNLWKHQLKIFLLNQHHTCEKRWEAVRYDKTIS